MLDIKDKQVLRSEDICVHFMLNIFFSKEENNLFPLLSLQK